MVLPAANFLENTTHCCPSLLKPATSSTSLEQVPLESSESGHAPTPSRHWTQQHQFSRTIILSTVNSQRCYYSPEYKLRGGSPLPEAHPHHLPTQLTHQLYPYEFHKDCHLDRNPTMCCLCSDARNGQRWEVIQGKKME